MSRLEDFSIGRIILAYELDMPPEEIGDLGNFEFLVGNSEKYLVMDEYETDDLYEDKIISMTGEETRRIPYELRDWFDFEGYEAYIRESHGQAEIISSDGIEHEVMTDHPEFKEWIDKTFESDNSVPDFEYNYYIYKVS